MLQPHAGLCQLRRRVLGVCSLPTDDAQIIVKRYMDMHMYMHMCMYIAMFSRGLPQHTPHTHTIYSTPLWVGPSMQSPSPLRMNDQISRHSTLAAYSPAVSWEVIAQPLHRAARILQERLIRLSSDEGDTP